MAPPKKGAIFVSFLCNFHVEVHETGTDREKWRATMTWCIQNEAHLEVVRFS